MIILPDGWEKMVQVREFMNPINRFASVGLLIFALKNDEDQYFVYEQSMEVSQGLISGTETSFKDIAQKSYQQLLYRMPSVAAQQTVVCSTKELMPQKYEPIKSQVWEKFMMPGLLKDYDDYIKEKEIEPSI